MVDSFFYSREFRKRFWSHVDPVPTAKGCLLWTGGTPKGKYGNIRIKSKNGVRHIRDVHVVAWEMKHGPRPKGYHIHHKCEVKTCVNEEHLELLTVSQHRKRHVKHKDLPQLIAGREARWQRYRERTHCSKGHLLNEANTYRYGGERRCKTCGTEYQKRRNTA